MAWKTWLMLKIYPIIRPLVGRNRRSSIVRFHLLDTLIVASDPYYKSKFFFFSAAQRARLYFRPDGVCGRLAEVGRKYRSEPVTVMPDDFVVDVGANVGEFSLFCHERGATVVAVEPDPVPLEALKLNASGKRIEVIQRGLSDKMGVIPFYSSSESADSSFVEPPSYTQIDEVSAVTLDDLHSELGMPDIDFLKVEAEGYEPEVLRGATTVLSNCAKVAVDVSPERRGESTWEPVRQILSEADFNVWKEGIVAFAIREARSKTEI